MEKEKKEKRIILILVLILFVSIIGFTIAYFMRSVSVENEFNTKDFETTAYEEFVSPNNWLPCDETPKTITVTNTGNVDAAVRISMQEKWVNANGNVISGLIDSNGNLTNNTNSEHAAIINIADDCNWQEDNGYYYYKHILKPGETTTALTDSVTFNCKTNASQTCTTSQDGKTVTCTSSGDGYDNANYTLTFKIDTIQYDAYEDVWTDDVHISDISYNPSTDSCSNSGNGNTNPNTNNTCLAEYSEPISLNGVEFYIIDDSNEEYTSLLKKDVLTASEVNACSTNYVSQDGEYPFYIDDEECDGVTNNSFCIDTYGQSSIREIVDCWSENFNNYIVEENLYDSWGRYVDKVGLVDHTNLFSNFCYERLTTPTSPSIQKGDRVPAFAIVDQKGYWTEYDAVYESGKVYVIRQGENLYADDVYNKHFIRPVIKAKKCVVTNSCQ